MAPFVLGFFQPRRAVEQSLRLNQDFKDRDSVHRRSVDDALAASPIAASAEPVNAGQVF